MKFRMQVSLVQMKNLFALKDEARALLEDLLNNQLNEGDSFAICMQFYNGIKDAGQTIKFTPEEMPKDSQIGLMPIELHYELEPEVEETMKRNLADIVESLSKKYGWVSDKSLADDYVILLEVLKFVLQQRKKLAKHFDIHDGDAEECDEDHEGSCCGSCFNSEEIFPCDVCGDEAFSVFCGSNVCGKCKTFFVCTMRNRTRLTLRCRGENEKCTNEFGALDITCAKCRLDVCEEKGMIRKYYSTEMQYPSGATCAVCRDAATHCPIRFVLGLYICFSCTDFFSLSINEKTFNQYECISGSRNCKDFKRICDLCWFKKFRVTGMLELYLAKSQEPLFKLPHDPDCDGTVPTNPVTFTRTEILDRDPDLCAVCDNSAASEQLMGVNCCKLCYLFLCASLDRQELSLTYCCPKGEFGVLCKLGESQRCSYCWLRRCEIEGLVDRWLSCNNDPFKWVEDLPECEDYSEDDEIHISEAENDVEENTEEEEKATPAEDLIEAHCGGGDDGDEVKNEENQLDIENNLATETVEVKEEPLSEAQNTDVSTNLKRSKRQAGARARSRNPTPDVTPAAKEGEGVDAPADAAEENQPLGMKKRGRKRKILMSL